MNADRGRRDDQDEEIIDVAMAVHHELEHAFSGSCIGGGNGTAKNDKSPFPQLKSRCIDNNNHSMLFLSLIMICILGGGVANVPVEPAVADSRPYVLYATPGMQSSIPKMTGRYVVTDDGWVFREDLEEALTEGRFPAQEAIASGIISSEEYEYYLRVIREHPQMTLWDYWTRSSYRVLGQWNGEPSRLYNGLFVHKKQDDDGEIDRMLLKVTWLRSRGYPDGALSLWRRDDNERSSYHSHCIVIDIPADEILFKHRPVVSRVAPREESPNTVTDHE